MMMFGAFYYVLPRMLDSEWHSAGLIRLHFWSCALGIAFYWISLTWGGWVQGLMMNDAKIPFLQIVAAMKPYLHARTTAGVLMTVGHVAFALLVWNMLRQRGARLLGPTLLGRTRRGAGKETA
jgi:cytochrome c oxidase cbb3-type subunit 1